MNAKAPISRFFRLFFRAVWWSFGVAVFAGLVLRWWSGDHFFLARYTGYLMPWLLIGLLPGMIWAGLMQHLRLATVLGLSAAIILGHHAHLFRFSQETSSRPAAEIKVITFNTWSKNPYADRIAQVVQNHRPDILLLQEINPKVFNALLTDLHGLYGEGDVYSAYAPALLQAVVSRYPLTSLEVFEEKAKAQAVRVELPRGSFIVFNVHPLWGNWLRRHNQLKALIEENVLAEPGPIILGGDFNTPDQTDTYRLISKYLNNAHGKAGRGFGFTFPSQLSSFNRKISLLPMVRIDHIFLSSHFEILTSYIIEDSAGSDHKPVAAEVQLKSI
ncbi:endonuclease/exonuclease/phosphatase family protein [uncultured Desulfuromonas sp.]|uniref:endonuclease/exonuclease/phosphatase family protein n=1 Tax=uncultured Desulfuromonas sp. TaxID=181013 RepID=UPI00260906D0|nr:endonuclease/exonuclease/phosphatase family protein [uncultured Desulfuromonas sp.]